MPTTQTDLSILHLILEATIPVQLVMLILVLISLASWTLIFSKTSEIGRVRKASVRFEETFWSGADLRALLEQVRSGRHGDGLSRVFEAGMKEFIKGREVPRQGAAPLSKDLALANAQRAMRAATQRELEGLEMNLPFLATAGSISPYIGLFGTVWGIMHAFTGLANIEQATLASVAPGIAEALVATAIGLFAAIPAVVGYNRFATQVDQLALRIDSFVDEFSNVLQQQG